jgi:glycosyltransferase involved in cell wall biosynthesis
LTKGVHIPEIVEAASLNNEWEFILLGEQRQADFRDLIEQVINVKFLGSFPHRFIPGFLSHASVGIALVDVEQPQKMLEYGAAGLVTLAYQGRLRRKFSDKQVYFVEASAISINATLNEIMRNTVDAKRRAEQLSDYAREYSWKSIAKKYYQEINRLT